MRKLIKTIGRREKETDALVSDDFLNDFTKIVQCKSYRRLAYKTQAISLPRNAHVRTRLAHTSEVMAVAATIATRLDLNVNLCLAIAAGHDVGHVPYGHSGERVLTKFGGKKFHHSINSIVVLQHIARKSKGLNLCFETLEGIKYHSKGSKELIATEDKPAEYAVVMFADKIAGILTDLNDAIRYSHLSEHDIPPCALKLGRNKRERMVAVINAIITESQQKNQMCFTDSEEYENFRELTEFMYDFLPKIDLSLQETILFKLCEYISDEDAFTGVDPVIVASLLTDTEADEFARLLLETRMPSIDQIKNFGVFEILPYIKGKDIDYADPDLEWGKEILIK
ncbi:HD domain-containing protein [Patescibacteria group bacterium]